MEELAKAEQQARAKKFMAQEGTPAHPGVPNDQLEPEEGTYSTAR